MSGYRGHIAGGAFFCLLYLMLLIYVCGLQLWVPGGGILTHGWERLAAIFVLSTFFALWPDIDTNSRGQDIVYGGSFLIDIALILSGQLEPAAYLGLLAMLPIIGRHRGWTHSVWAMAAVPLPILIVPYLHQPGHWQGALIYYGAAVAGYLSHLVLDGLIIPLPGRRHHGWSHD